MKNLLSIAIAVSFVFAACARTERTNIEKITADEPRSLDSFERISVANSITLIMEKGSKNEARIETSGMDTDKVIVENAGSTLKIYIDYRDRDFWDNIGGSGSATVYLTFTENLTSLKASNSSSIRSKSLIKSDEFSVKVSNSATIEADVDTDELELSISNSGRIKMNAEADELEVSITNSGKVSLSGETAEQEISITNSGRYDGYGMKSERSDITIRNSGTAEVSVSKELIVDATNSGKVYYKGEPTKILANSENSAKVRKAN